MMKAGKCLKRGKLTVEISGSQNAGLDLSKAIVRHNLSYEDTGMLGVSQYESGRDFV